jgi:tRNA-5-methyluridine54 2-sulfurtransferase
VKCMSCKERAVFSEPRLCKTHFSEYIEGKVKKTIRRFRLLKKSDQVAVAVSGGKDSLTLLHILSKFGYSVTAIAIDEGIVGYRDKTLKRMVSFCRERGIKHEIISFKKEIGKSLDSIVKKDFLPCSVCGVLRRYLLNKHSRSYDVIATGHNLDDESQAVIMNLAKNNLAGLLRSGPISGIARSKSLTKRVKPLILCTEKEIMAYSFINRITTDFNECPYVSRSFRLRVREGVNLLESSLPGAKRNIIEWSLGLKRDKAAAAISSCTVCGEASSNSTCQACETIRRIRCS